jgi:hypothetical protein
MNVERSITGSNSAFVKDYLKTEARNKIYEESKRAKAIAQSIL